jgi:hypothetical protein
VLRPRAIHKILKQIKDGKNTNNRRNLNPKRSIHTDAIITAVAIGMAADCQICIRVLASFQGTFAGTIFAILPEELVLIKKSAR